MTLQDKVEKLAQEASKKRKGRANYKRIEMRFWSFQTEVEAACREYSGILRGHLSGYIEDRGLEMAHGWYDFSGRQLESIQPLIETWKRALK